MDKDHELLQGLYSKITPRGFEIFLKDFLQELGFDEIEVTKQSGDSGIDLTAVLRNSEIPGIETNMSYKIQAKRYKPESTLNPRYIRELRGSMKSGERGILITTAKVTNKSIEEEAVIDISRMVLVIDGGKLIELCKKNEIGICKQYEIDEEYLSGLESAEASIQEDELLSMTKLVSENDIRARILRIPKDLKPHLRKNSKIFLYFDDDKKGSYTIDKTGTYVGGVSKIFNTYGLIGPDGTAHAKNAEWTKYKEGFLVKFTQEEKKKVKNIPFFLQKILGALYRREGRSAFFKSEREEILCRVSKRYSKEHNYYWFGVLPRDIVQIRKKQIKRLIFICGEKMAVEINANYFLSITDKLNATYYDNEQVRHYHVYFREEKDNIIWKGRGGEKIEVNKVYKI